VSGRQTGEIYIPAVFVTYNSGRQLLSVIEQPGTICYISSTFENTAWSVMAVSFISLLAVSAVLATFFFVRRHRLRR
jgi:E3 ubiquitin-protein ligase RNF13